MKAVMYGAGNIGRGFIGALLSGAGYEVTFIDIMEDVVAGLRRRGSYPVRIISGEGYQDVLIDHVTAVHGHDSSAVADAIAGADIMATAVGVNVLRHIIPNIAEGLRRRFAAGEAPLDIIICENLMDADKVIEGMLIEQLTPEERELLKSRVGLVEASIGRMVPVQTPEMKDGDPLRVCVERYGFLPVDRDAFVGVIPDIDSLVPYSPFSFYLKRKLYVHNMGHALCAYLGQYAGDEFIWQAVDNPEIQLMAKNAMLESMQALCAAYGTPAVDLLCHIDDLLLRFGNRALGDTCARVGGDTTRKLGAADRLIGAARFCREQGIMPAHIAVGAAGALLRHQQENRRPQTADAALDTLTELSGLEERDELTQGILTLYRLLAEGESLSRLRKTAQALRGAVPGSFV